MIRGGISSYRMTIRTQRTQYSIPDSTSRARVLPTCVRVEQPFIFDMMNARCFLHAIFFRISLKLEHHIVRTRQGKR